MCLSQIDEEATKLLALKAWLGGDDGKHQSVCAQNGKGKTTARLFADTLHAEHCPSRQRNRTGDSNLVAFVSEHGT